VVKGAFVSQRIVILDIGGVLEFNPRTGWQDRWTRRLGLPDGAVAARTAETIRLGSVGTIDLLEVHRRFAEELGITPEAAEQLQEDHWEEYVGTPNTELIDALTRLDRREAFGILSNSFVGAREREVERYGFDRLAREIVYSHEIGVLKPDPRAYATACERMRAAPADCLFVDDLPENVAAARATGMQAVVFEDTPSTVRAVARHLAT
jgi:putative hydrolase of the HAD superfamily